MAVIRDIHTHRSLVRSGTASCETITRGFLDSIREHESLNAFRALFPEESLGRARAIDAKRSTAGALAGVVLATKDNICRKGKPTGCCSKILEGYVSPYDATVVRRLEEADAVLVGTTNMDEFAMGSSTENSAYGTTRHPLDAQRVPGGSSGGSAAAVAAGLVTAALGSDTGGSIRQPASFCGVVGLKPTYGRVSRYGLVAFASSLDQIGPLTRTVRDAAEILQVIAGHDPSDATSSREAVPAYVDALTRDVKGLRVGLPKEYFTTALDKGIADAIMSRVEFLRARGAVVRDVSLPHAEYSVATYYVISTAEASSNLARFDGARYGRRSDGTTLAEMYTRSRSEGFGNEVKRRIMLGTYVLSAGYYDAYYRKAQKMRRLIVNDFENAFREVDCILTPTTPTTAFAVGEKAGDPLTMYLSDVFTVSANLAGIPGLSIPCGKDAKGLPIGLQILGKRFDESTILRTGDFLESV